jgi:hypothetical protein
MVTPDCDPDAFRPILGTALTTCLRCGAVVEGNGVNATRHHDWHVALDTALAAAGAPFGALAPVSQLRA